MSDEPVRDEPGGAAASDIGLLLHSRSYVSMLVLASLLGIPLSFVAFGFLAGVHELEHVVWETIPTNLGFDGPPAWWPVVALGIAGFLVALAVMHLPGHGGHVPADGLGAGATPPGVVPGVILAAGASLVLGAVVGPEAPLIALGSGLALFAVKGVKSAQNPTASALIAASGSAAAISAIFGNPLVAAVMFLEVLGLARRQTMMVVLPCLVSSGVGAMVFTGLGEWTGLEIGALSIPNLGSAQLVANDIVWAIPVAAVVALGTWGVFNLGQRTAQLARTHTMAVTVAAGLLTGCLAAVYALITGHSPTDVTLSGQATLATLGVDPESWTTGALVLLLVCKGLAYGLCLGAFRGGAVFPAVFLGATIGVLANEPAPGIGIVPGLAIGMAAGAAATGLPVTSVVLVVLLLEDAATELMPIIILGTVTALVIEEFLRTSTGRRTEGSTPKAAP